MEKDFVELKPKYIFIEEEGGISKPIISRREGTYVLVQRRPLRTVTPEMLTITPKEMKLIASIESTPTEKWSQLLKSEKMSGEIKPATEDESELVDLIKSIVIKVAPAAQTTSLPPDNKYDYFKSEVGMNIVLPKGSIEELRFIVTLKGDESTSSEVVAIDGFPNDSIKEKPLVQGKITVAIDEFLKFIPIIGNITSPIKIILGPWEFKIGNLRRVDIDFSGGLTYKPDWYFKKNGIKNDLRVALTIRKPKNIKNIKACIKAVWRYNPGLGKKAKVDTDKKTITIMDNSPLSTPSSA